MFDWKFENFLLRNKICLTSATFWEVAKESLSDQYQSMTKTNKVKLLQVIFSIIPLSDKNVYIDLEEVFEKNVLKEQSIKCY